MALSHLKHVVNGLNVLAPNGLTMGELAKRETQGIPQPFGAV